MCHESPLGRDVPLVFAGDSPPALDALAAGVRAQADGGDSATSVAEHPTAPGGAFGSRQRWSLTRLRWTAPKESPLLLVRRGTFMEQAEVASWTGSPPDDAVPMPPGTTDLVDGELPDGQTAFYVVLVLTDAWRAAPLSPVPAPYLAQGEPFELGSIAERLTTVLEDRLRALDSEDIPGADILVSLDLVEGLVSSVPPEAREGMNASIARLRQTATP